MIQSQACAKAPDIDGVIGDDEWLAAPPIEFEMKMVQLDVSAVAMRSCQLRVMNSANGLYLALRVPDPTSDNRLSPLNMDVAILAFCQEAELRRGDDRKLVMPGLYVDKHFVEPGKDADDGHQDGRGVMTYDQDTYAMEWAIPVNPGDTEDVQLQPGGKVRSESLLFRRFSE